MYFIQRRHRQHSRTEKLFNLQWKKRLWDPNTAESPQNLLFGRNLLGDYLETTILERSRWCWKFLKVSGQQKQSSTLCFSKTGPVSDGYLNTCVNNPKLYSWVDPTRGESGEGFVTDPKKGKKRDGERGVGGNMRRWEWKGVYFSERSRRTCLLPSALRRFAVFSEERHPRQRGILPRAFGLTFFTLKRPRMPAHSLNSLFSASCLLRV